jgi:hypothetical protein
MTSRLYRTTRPLATQVALMVRPLGISGVGSPTTARSGDRDPQKRISKEGDEMLIVGSW